MGLRERNAAQTRDLLVDTALSLFVEQGYHDTTMEQIASRAEVGQSTLYRYFPSKDALVVQPLGLHGQMAAELRARPADEALDVALGHALRAFLVAPRIDRVRRRQILEVLRTAEAPNQRLREEYLNERTLLEEAVAERVGRPADDLYCIMSARLTTTTLELISQLERELPDNAEPVESQILELAEQVIGALQAEPPLLPRL